MSMLTFEPFRGFDTVTRRMFDTMSEMNRNVKQQVEQFSPRVDIAETEKAISLHVEIPGVQKDDVKISINEDRILSIRGEKKQRETIEGQQFVRVESHFGTFARSFTLSDSIDINGIQAEFNSGILQITLPKVEPEKPKSIEVPIA
jgi:HSP20 family protein